jgi:hypothetical protein
MSDGPQEHLLVSFQYKSMIIVTIRHKIDFVFGRFRSASKLKRSNTHTQHFANIVTPILKDMTNRWI